MRGSSAIDPDLKRAGIEHAHCRDHMSHRRVQMQPHVIDPHRSRHRVDQSGGANRRRGQQPRPCRAFPEANVNEIMVTSKLAAHLLARSAMYPACRSGDRHRVRRRGTELYRVALPADCDGMSMRTTSRRSSAQSTRRRCWRWSQGLTCANPGQDFRVALDDDLVVVAESLGDPATARAFGSRLAR